MTITPAIQSPASRAKRAASLLAHFAKQREPAAVFRRFMKYVSMERGGCWNWTGTKGRWGHGQFAFRGRMVKAYRFLYERTRGPIPEGLTLDHLCRNPSCVRPSHLEPVTSRENVLRSDAPPARNARKSHCSNGHPFDQVRKDGGRRCSICYRASRTKWQREVGNVRQREKRQRAQAGLL